MGEYGIGALIVNLSTIWWSAFCPLGKEPPVPIEWEAPEPVGWFGEEKFLFAPARNQTTISQLPSLLPNNYASLALIIMPEN
jgi:hypothetical protein